MTLQDTPTGLLGRPALSTCHLTSEIVSTAKQNLTAHQSFFQQQITKKRTNQPYFHCHFLTADQNGFRCQQINLASDANFYSARLPLLPPQVWAKRSWPLLFTPLTRYFFRAASATSVCDVTTFNYR
jgi:hypothetical protein